MKSALSFLLFIGLFSTALLGCSPAGPHPFEVRDAWARPGFSGGTSGVYLTIDNSAGSTDILLSASSTAAERTELHQTQMDQAGTMRMEPLQSIEVANNSILSLAPGGLHIMLISLSQDLNPGDSFELTLSFQQKGEVSVNVEVREPN